MNMNGAASADALREAQGGVRHALPPDYVAFMRRCNGGEGWIGDFYLMLDRVEELPAFQDPWGDESEPFVIFGSNGGGELFAFDAGKDMAVFMIPAIGGPKHAIYAAPTFSGLLQRLARGEDLFASDIANPS
jgi:SMI1 / KNR4 family (SUKH-1)